MFNIIFLKYIFWNCLTDLRWLQVIFTLVERLWVDPFFYYFICSHMFVYDGQHLLFLSYIHFLLRFNALHCQWYNNEVIFCQFIIWNNYFFATRGYFARLQIKYSFVVLFFVFNLWFLFFFSVPIYDYSFLLHLWFGIIYL